MKKIKNAYRLAAEAFDEELNEHYEIDGEARAQAIAPMAAEIYRQMNRVLIITMPEGAAHDLRHQMVEQMKPAFHTGHIVIFPHDYQVICPEDDSVSVEVQAEDVEEGGGST